MEDLVKKGFLASLMIVFLFFMAIPATEFYAQETANQNSSADYIEHWFGEDATVESVRAEFSSIDPGISVIVTDQDGNLRTTGFLQEGDIVTTFDKSGALFQSFINLSPDSSEEGPSSQVSNGGDDSSSDSGLPPEQSQISSSSQASSEESSAPSNPSSQESSASSGSSSQGSSASSGSSSQETSSDVSAPSSAGESPASSSTPPSSSDPYFHDDEDYCQFDRPTTVDELKSQLRNDGVRDSQLTVKTKDGTLRQGGAVCTGDELTVFNPDGTVQNCVKVIVFGDLTRCGRPDDAACGILYGYLTGSQTLSADLRCAADLNQDGAVTTSDLLQLKKMVFNQK